MIWLIAVIAGHFFNAVSYVLDKVLLSKSIENPYAFTFFIGVLGIISVALVPLGFEYPGAKGLIIDLSAGVLFIVALVAFFYTLQASEASRAVPFVGAGIPLFTWMFELLFLDQQLSLAQIGAFFVLVFGTAVIMLDVDQKQKAGAALFPMRVLGFGLLAAILFAVSFGVTKIAFIDQPFVSAFIWMRLGSFIAACTLLASGPIRKAIRAAVPLFKTKKGALYMTAQAFGGIGFLLVNYGISLASVALVNALQGVQYAFLLIMAVIGSLWYPKMLSEMMSRRSLAVKIVGVLVIGIGLILVAQTTNA